MLILPLAVAWVIVIIIKLVKIINSGCEYPESQFVFASGIHLAIPVSIILILFLVPRYPATTSLVETTRVETPIVSLEIAATEKNVAYIYGVKSEVGNEHKVVYPSDSCEVRVIEVFDNEYYVVMYKQYAKPGLLSLASGERVIRYEFYVPSTWTNEVE